MALSLASCEKNNGNENKPLQNLVKSMTFYTNGFSDLTLIERKFGYDEQGRLNHSELLWEGTLVMKSDIVYEDKMIVETLVSSTEQEKAEYRYYLNEDGYLIKSEANDNFFSSNISTLYEYENGELIRIISEDDYGQSEHMYMYHWYNGDVTGVAYEYDTEYIEYSDLEDKFSVDYAAYWWSILDDTYNICSPSMIKFKGTTSKHLPQSFDGINLSYDLDTDGRIMKIKVYYEDSVGVIELDYFD